ncbi:MAG TPA: hypothetical protein VK605_02255, partial [Solirubrobacteraceae bacterium]|nr:hypothetical protein [Solirubrobacteraceae bacterium]
MSTGVPSPSRTPAGSSAIPSAASPADGREPVPERRDEAYDADAAPASAREDERAVGRSRWIASPQLNAREIAWVIVAGVALAVLTSWPLVLHMSTRIAPDLGDPVRTAWQVAYVGHAMLHDPLHL